MNPAEIAEQIMSIQLPDDVISEAANEFYQLMQKYGVEQGTPSEDGRGIIYDNFDWTLYKTLFIDTLKSQIEFMMMW